MFNNFFEYLKNNYNQIEIFNRLGFCFKEVPLNFSEYYQSIIKKKNVHWKPETLGIISYVDGISEDELSQIEREIKCIKENSLNYPYNVESIPKWLFKFYKSCWALSIFQESLIFSTSLAQSAACIKPKCLNGKFFVGQYAGITPKSCPIFTDESGSMYVYASENFRNYPRTDSKSEINSYLNQEVELIATWSNVDLFLIEETERLKELFIKKPSIYAIENCSPHK